MKSTAKIAKAVKKKKTTGAKEAIVFYASGIGMPFATQGKYIAGWQGKINGKDFFCYKTIKKFEKDHFPIAKLRVIEYGMPMGYIRGLKSALKEANGS